MLNKVLLQGRLTKDPEMLYTPNGITVVRASLAVDRNYVKQGEERKTDFINVVAYRNTAEFFGKYFKKGQMAVIAGSIATSSYTDKDGKKVYKTDVVIDEVHFCEKKETQQSTEQHTPQNTQSDDSFMIVDDKDLPF